MNFNTIKQELNKKIKKMSEEDFQKFIKELKRIYYKDKPKPWEMQYELSKETENWDGCYPDPNLGHGENWESEEE